MGETIFVIEDDTNINQVVCEYLKDAGFIAESFLDGGEAWSKAANHSCIDLFILDIMLPSMSGFDLLKLIRSNTLHRNKPTIMLTALDDETTQLYGFELLADDYVTKPFSPKILIKRVESLLRRKSGGYSELHLSDIKIDFDSCEAHAHGEEIHLTAMELELIKVLAKEPGKVLSRQEILDEIWGHTYFGDERIVDVHVKNLRKKFNSNVISTVKGIGYKLEKG